ncbi:2870_t:CDS:10 [Paraglomus occultum]|uniref:2870_t:CDS:1 n=1 Tax=Paraglomus occultum TaxID=144539 RepID=A0A9N8W826_9GLOM|nr:2870_t:CDS:10 [Paraglomus occultum]
MQAIVSHVSAQALFVFQSIYEDAFFLSLLAIGTWLIHQVYKLHFEKSPINAIPGPKSWRWTVIPHALFLYLGPGHEKARELHQKYGPVVRIAPDSVLVADKNVVKQILVTAKDYQKADIYKIIFGAGVPGLLTTIDRQEHKQRRRLLSPAFSITQLKSIEPHISNTVTDLCAFIEKSIENAGKDGWTVVDMMHALRLMAFDVTGHGANAGMADQLIWEMTQQLFSPLPVLSWFVPSLPGPKLRKFLMSLIEEHRQAGEDRVDVLKFLLESKGPLTDEQIVKELVLIFFAGTARTSVTLTITLLLLHLHPEKLAKLLSEIHATFPDPNEPVTHTKCKEMQYLNAVISETMRYYPIVGPGWMPRTFPYDLRVGDVVVPKGTEIISSIYTLQHAEEYWPNPDKFIPERFFAENNPSWDAFYPFSAGENNCIGKNVAWVTMEVALVTLLRKFELELLPENEQTRQLVMLSTFTVKGESLKMKVKRRAEV